MEEIEKVVEEAEVVSEQAAPEAISALLSAGEGLVAGFRKFMAVGNGRVSKHQMGKRGAHHNHQPTFKSRRILPMTPAQYRHFHFGKTKKEATNESAA